MMGCDFHHCKKIVKIMDFLAMLHGPHFENHFYTPTSILYGSYARLMFPTTYFQCIDPYASNLFNCTYSTTRLCSLLPTFQAFTALYIQ